MDKTSNTKSVVSEPNQGKAIFSDGKRHGEEESSIWYLELLGYVKIILDK